MQEKTYTLNIRQIGKFQYEVTIPEIGATKTAPTLDSALNITLCDILKHLTARYLILVFTEHLKEIASGWSTNTQEHILADQEHEASLLVAQLGIAPQVKKREHHLVFELSCPLTREQVTWLDKHAGKLFERYYIKDDLEIELDGLREGAHEKEI